MGNEPSLTAESARGSLWSGQLQRAFSQLLRRGRGFALRNNLGGLAGAAFAVEFRGNVRARLAMHRVQPF